MLVLRISAGDAVSAECTAECIWAVCPVVDLAAACAPVAGLAVDMAAACAPVASLVVDIAAVLGTQGPAEPLRVGPAAILAVFAEMKAAGARGDQAAGTWISAFLVCPVRAQGHLVLVAENLMELAAAAISVLEVRTIARIAVSWANFWACPPTVGCTAWPATGLVKTGLQRIALETTASVGTSVTEFRPRQTACVRNRRLAIG